MKNNNENNKIINNNNSIFCLVIDILNDVAIKGLPLDQTITQHICDDHLQSLNQFSFQAIIKKYTLDFKQSSAFETMACSFILKSLHTKKHN